MNCLETLRCETCQEQSMAKIVENGGSSIAISVKNAKNSSMVFDVLQYPVSELKIFYCISVLWTKCSISVKNSKKDNCKNKRSGTLGRAFMYASHIWLRNINEVHSSTKSSRGKTKTWNYGFLNIIDYEFSSQISGTSTI